MPAAIGTLPPGPRYRWRYGDPTPFLGDRLRFLGELVREYGDCCRFRLGFRELYVLNHPDDIRRLLVSEQRRVRRSGVTQLTRFVLGGSVFNAGAATHHQQRRRLGPLLHRDSISAYTGIIADEAHRLQADWRDGAIVVLPLLTRRLALAIAGRAWFDADLGWAAPRIDAALRALFLAMNRFDHPRDWFSWTLPSVRNLRIVRAVLTLRALVRRTIEAGSRSSRNSATILRMLLETRDRGEISDRLVRDEIMLLMVAGHETTAQALAWTLFLLAGHPEIQSRLHAELDDAPTHGLDDLKNLAGASYLGMVIREALRLYPASPIFDRQTTVPIDVAGYRIPARRTVLVSPYITHRDRRFFTEPTRFDPARWDGMGAGVFRADAYFPFGLGPRRCIGEFFALAEMTLAVAVIARRWRLERVDGAVVEPEALITLRPRRDIRLRVVRREPLRAPATIT